MLQFVDTERETPEKRAPAERRQDFREIYRRFSEERARVQAGRCSQCGIPFCQQHCPLHNNIPDWLLLTAEGRLEEAYEISSATNILPEICGRICPQDRLCEGNCVIEQAGHGTVTIGSIETYITETALERGWVRPAEPASEREESVGIIGGGPAGFAAAHRLRHLGYQVEIYDRYDRAGGLFVYGIPSFKLDKSIVERRVKWLVDSGVRFTLNFEVGRDASLAELRGRHDAVLVATGVYKPREITAPGAGLGGIVQAIDYLRASDRKVLGSPSPDFDSGALNAKGRDVVVVGGGDTAMDCVRTAVRQGARSVKCLYRRDRENMPGSVREVQHAEEEGVEFVWLSQPEAFLGDGAVTGVRTQLMRLGLPDASGRQSPQPIEGDVVTHDASLVIKALGFDPEDLPGMFGEPALPVTGWGTLRIDWKSMMTGVEGVFAAGDIVRGASLVVWAIRDARDAADGIHAHIEPRRRATPPMAS
jgi:glutamate synthase (NADPH/NADH) small chain